MTPPIVLVCIFGISRHSTGFARRHVLTPAEIEDRIAMLETDPASFYEAQALINRALCQKVFKQRADLAWVEGDVA